MSGLSNSPLPPRRAKRHPVLCEFLISRRYLFAHKSQNAINVISAISALGVLVATAAIVIVLSVFNGLNGLVSGLFGNFDPDVKIEAAEGKSFAVDSALVSTLNSDPYVAAWAEVVQDNALVRYGKRQVPATVMGVAGNYNSVTCIDSIIVEGAFRPGECLIGAVLADQLGVSSSAFVPSVVFYAPKRYGKINIANPQNSFSERVEKVGGTFMVQQVDYDGSYILADLDLARDLLGYADDEVTSISLRLAEGVSSSAAVETLTEKLGESLVVKDKWMQHESFFKMMEVEKLMAFSILLFIALIAAFNIIGSMSMLIFEKKDSVDTLRAMGADRSFVTRIFLFEGWMLSVGGALLGLVVGILMVLAQEHWGIVGFGGDETYIIDAYPVELRWLDVAVVFVAVILIAGLSAWYPVRAIVGRYFKG